MTTISVAADNGTDGVLGNSKKRSGSLDYRRESLTSLLAVCDGLCGVVLASDSITLPCAEQLLR